MKVTIGWKSDNGIVEDQIKSFKEEIDAVAFCRRHYKNICHINGKMTYYELVSHFMIMDAINLR